MGSVARVPCMCSLLPASLTCRRPLMQAWLKKKGLAAAGKRAGKVASEGVIETYVHFGASLGVLIEVNCETDFVAKGDAFKELATSLAMQVCHRMKQLAVSFICPARLLGADLWEDEAQALVLLGCSIGAPHVFSGLCGTQSQ
jgi:hypothetical protein